MYANVAKSSTKNSVYCKEPLAVLADSLSEEMKILVSAVDSTDDVYKGIIDEQPQFPGGMDALFAIISKNMRYPETARLAKAEGMMLVRFIIDKDGNIQKPRVLKSVHPDLDAEAIRIIKMLPKWKPAMAKGEPVNEYFTLPITCSTETEVKYKLAQFPGGRDALFDFVKQNLKYPETARLAEIEGEVDVKFTIDKDGKVQNPKCVKSVHKDLDAEAIRIVNMLPDWTPEISKGKPVESSFVLTIPFKIEGLHKVVEGSYTKSRNKHGFDEYIFGIMDKYKQKYKVTVSLNVKSQNEELRKEITKRVFGSENDFETALKAYRETMDEVKIKDTKEKKNYIVEEYCTQPNGVVGIKYNTIVGAMTLQRLADSENFLFDTSKNKVVTLADLIAPTLSDALKAKGVEPEKSSNIAIEDKMFYVITPKMTLNMDVAKLKANLSDYALEIIGITR